MEWLKNLKIAHKLYMLITVSILIVLAFGVFQLWNINQMTKAMNDMYDHSLIAISDLQTIRGNENLIQYEIVQIFQTKDQNDIKRREQKMKKLGDEQYKKMDEYQAMKLDQYELDKIDRLRKVGEIDWAHIKKELNMTKQGKGPEAFESYKKNRASKLEYRKVLDELIQYNENKAKQAATKNHEQGESVKLLLVVVGLSSIGLILILGLTITQMITKPIKEATDEISHASNQVASASSQVSAASQHLAEGTTQQAASVQETASTLEESASMVRQNKENTQQASSLANKIKGIAENNVSNMHNAMGAMNKLKESSNEIGKIIKVIDEIAFQTNILSLNAAVEAARAGEAGKGFAVVAEEVRNLAQRSAKAAQESTGIIEENISLSEMTNMQAQGMLDSNIEVESEVKKITGLLEEIAVATSEQAQGVEQISKAMSQMEIVVDSNAQTAEEAASASHTLNTQAANAQGVSEKLMRLVEGQ